MAIGNEIWITSKGRTYLNRLDKRVDRRSDLRDNDYWDLQVLSLLWETSEDSPEILSDILSEDSSGQFIRYSSNVHRAGIKRLAKDGYIDLA